MKIIMAFIVGVIFSIGLAMSGMTKPQVVRGFLDVFGDWNPALVGVMIGAIVVHSLSYQFIKRREAPILDDKFHIPTRRDLDKKLIMGAMIFGLGWGWAGICPGPGIVGLLSGNSAFVYFIVSMLLGMKIFQFVERRKP